MSMQEIVESKSRRENNAAGLPPTHLLAILTFDESRHTDS
jgi:hypothetical protein